MPYKAVIALTYPTNNFRIKSTKKHKDEGFDFTFSIIIIINVLA